MASGKRQHIVPQQMIKRFAGSDGKLIGLCKKNLRIGSRRRSPSGILFKDNYYRDICSDLDDDLFKKVEQKFALYYPLVVDGEKPKELCGEGGAALIDWISSMLCRTQALALLSSVIISKETSEFKYIPHDILINLVRTQYYTECQDVLSRTDFKWRIKCFHEGCDIILTDNPVCQTNGLHKGGQAVLVPLSKRFLLIGGLEDSVEEFRKATIDEINLFLFAWTYDSIYAAEKDTLESLKAMLDTVDDEVFIDTAKKPLFGLPERIKEKDIPVGLNTNEWWEQIKNSYGDSIIPDEYKLK